MSGHSNLLSSLIFDSSNDLKVAHCFFCNQEVKQGCFWDGVGFRDMFWESDSYEPIWVLIIICQNCIPKLGMLAGVAQSEPSRLVNAIERQPTDDETLSKFVSLYWQSIAGTRKSLLDRSTNTTRSIVNKLNASETNNEELNKLNNQLEMLIDTEANRTEGAGWVYLMHRRNGDHKIGLSGNVDRRLEQIKKDHPQVQLIHKIAVDDMRQAEVMLHEEFAEKRQDGEWFSLSPEDVELVIRRVRFEDGWFLERYDNLPIKDENTGKKQD